MNRGKDQRKGPRRVAEGSSAVMHKKRNKHELKSQTPKRGAIVITLFLLIVFFLGPAIYPKHYDTVNIRELKGKRTDAAHIDRIEDFLDNFVCKYKAIGTADISGYCHPKLQSTPQNRTQVVSSSRRSISATEFSLKYTIEWWMNALYPSFSVGIAAGEHLMTLPRPLQIWDLDALRDEFIQRNFLGISSDSSTAKLHKRIALHEATNNPLDSGAYLAVFMLRLLHGSQLHECGADNKYISESRECIASEHQNDAQASWSNTNQHSERIAVLRDYLEMLPRYDDRISRSPNTNNIHEHPIGWNKKMTESMFPKYTHTYNLIVSYQTMVQSEYDGLKSVSPEFGANVNFTEYMGMRINVLSRAFSAIASADDIGSSWNTFGKRQSLSDEIKSYTTSNFGVSESATTQMSEEFKFRSMCPLLDMYNSHPNPNVVWRYDRATSSYLIHANSEGIPPGHQVIVSYGKYTEGHLFAKYGYVNGDGSSKTEASLNVFHRILGDVGLSWQYSQLPFNSWVQHHGSSSKHLSAASKHLLDMQSKELLRYLMFDDGHKECIQFENLDNSLSRQQELKWLKFQHLKRLANIGEAWTVRLPARFPNAQPLGDSTLPESASEGYDSRVGIDARKILSICRLLSLTTADIDGDAIIYLKEGLAMKQTHFQVEKHGNALEYRSLMCVARLSYVAFRRYGVYTQPNGNAEPKKSNNREWTAWYIRDGEMRLLSTLRQTALSEANRLKNQHHLLSTDIFMREKPCPIEHSMSILQVEANLS